MPVTDDGVSIKILVGILGHVDIVDHRRFLAAALLAELRRWTRLSADSGAAMAARQGLLAAQVARQARTRRATGQRAAALVLALPHAWLQTRRARFMAWLGAAAVGAADIASLLARPAARTSMALLIASMSAKECSVALGCAGAVRLSAPAVSALPRTLVAAGKSDPAHYWTKRVCSSSLPACQRCIVSA